MKPEAVTPAEVGNLECWAPTEEGHKLKVPAPELTFATRKNAGGYAATVTCEGTEYTIWPNGDKAEPNVFPRGPVFRDEKEAAAAAARWFANKWK